MNAKSLAWPVTAVVLAAVGFVAGAVLAPSEIGLPSVNGAGVPDPSSGPGAPSKGQGAETKKASGPMAKGEGPQGKGAFRPPTPVIMTTIDADKDGDLSAKEISDAPAALKGLDKDGDGIVTAAELRPTPPPGTGRLKGIPGPRDNPKVMAERVLKLDKNGDNKLTADELSEELKHLIAEADFNGDKGVDMEELLRYGGLLQMQAPVAR